MVGYTGDSRDFFDAMDLLVFVDEWLNSFFF